MANQKARFVALVVLIKRFEAKAHYFIAIFDIMTILNTRSDTQKLSKIWQFCVDDDDDDDNNNDMTDYLG